MDTVMMLTKNMTPEQQMMFTMQYGDQKKSVGVYAVLSLFLGCLGVQHFYLGRTGLGVICLLISCTGIGLFLTGIAAIADAICSSGRVNKFNTKVAEDIAVKIKMFG